MATGAPVLATGTAAGLADIAAAHYASHPVIAAVAVGTAALFVVTGRSAARRERQAKKLSSHDKKMLQRQEDIYLDFKASGRLTNKPTIAERLNQLDCDVQYHGPSGLTSWEHVTNSLIAGLVSVRKQIEICPAMANQGIINQLANIRDGIEPPSAADIRLVRYNNLHNISLLRHCVEHSIESIAALDPAIKIPPSMSRDMSNAVRNAARSFIGRADAVNLDADTRLEAITEYTQLIGHEYPRFAHREHVITLGKIAEKDSSIAVRQAALEAIKILGEAAPQVRPPESATNNWLAISAAQNQGNPDLLLSMVIGNEDPEVQLAAIEKFDNLLAGDASPAGFSTQRRAEKVEMILDRCHARFTKLCAEIDGAADQTRRDEMIGQAKGVVAVAEAAKNVRQIMMAVNPAIILNMEDYAFLSQDTLPEWARGVGKKNVRITIDLRAE